MFDKKMAIFWPPWDVKKYKNYIILSITYISCQKSNIKLFGKAFRQKVMKTLGKKRPNLAIFWTKLVKLEFYQTNGELLSPSNHISQLHTKNKPAALQWF